MADNSEEKRLPASEKKLREGRRKGQVPHSRDLVAGFTLFAALLYLFVAWPVLSDRIIELAQTVSGPLSPELLTRAIRQVFATILLTSAPLVAILITATVLFGMIATRGPVFSFETIKPQFERINPGKGIERLASLHNLVEFIKGLVKTVFLACLFIAVLLAWLQAMVEAPGCGETCIGPMVLSVLAPVGAAAALAFIVIGILDVPIQRWLFRRDMRMTRTEFRREQKDLEGHPQIRQELRRQRQDAVARPTWIGLHNAVLVVASRNRVVALRYVKDETPIPVVVGTARDEAVAALLTTARDQGTPIVEDAVLADALFETSRPGGYVDPDHFTPLVRHLVRLKLV